MFNWQRINQAFVYEEVTVEVDISLGFADADI
jgi:hypothetical protein